MSYHLLSNSAKPSTPAAGKSIVWVDSYAKILCLLDDAGKVKADSAGASISSQGTGFATDTYVTGSNLIIPSFGLQSQTRVAWKVSASKTAAGIAAPIYQIRIGTSASTVDTPLIALTGPAQTAIADIGVLNIMATVRTIGASAVIQATAWWDHRGTAATSTIGTGFANDGTGAVEATSSPFNSTTFGANAQIGLSINGGASAAWLVTQCNVDADW